MREDLEDSLEMRKHIWVVAIRIVIKNVDDFLMHLKQSLCEVPK